MAEGFNFSPGVSGPEIIEIPEAPRGGSGINIAGLVIVAGLGYLGYTLWKKHEESGNGGGNGGGNNPPVIVGHPVGLDPSHGHKSGGGGTGGGGDQEPWDPIQWGPGSGPVIPPRGHRPWDPISSDPPIHMGPVIVGKPVKTKPGRVSSPVHLGPPIVSRPVGMKPGRVSDPVHLKPPIVGKPVKTHPGKVGTPVPTSPQLDQWLGMLNLTWNVNRSHFPTEANFMMSQYDNKYPGNATNPEFYFLAWAADTAAANNNPTQGLQVAFAEATPYPSTLCQWQKQVLAGAHLPNLWKDVDPAWKKQFTDSYNESCSGTI